MYTKVYSTYDNFRMQSNLLFADIYEVDKYSKTDTHYTMRYFTNFLRVVRLTYFCTYKTIDDMTKFQLQIHRFDTERLTVHKIAMNTRMYRQKYLKQHRKFSSHKIRV